jgi:poly(3-hydroxybutyrate) depolymerase
MNIRSCTQFSILSTLLAMGLAACGGSNSSNGTELSSTPAAAALASTGPGVSDEQNCDVPYGDAPAALATLTSGEGSGAAEEVLGLLNQCASVGGQTLNWTDSQNEARQACLFVPPGASAAAPLPLIVHLQGSLAPAPPQLLLNGWIPLTQTADLNGNAQRPGFILLLPIGRNTHHYYPFPDQYALGFDNWYRNLDRGSPDLNLDVAAVDQFIAQVEAMDIVDTDRVYVTGWSNGGALAELYALNTPSIAATAEYSAPAPFSDVQDPCYQTPFATTLTPVMDIHNACDIVGTCQTSSAFHQNLTQLFPKLQQNVVLIEGSSVVQACNASCASPSPELDPIGNANHLIWPTGQNDAIFTWLRQHPLSVKPQQ